MRRMIWLVLLALVFASGQKPTSPPAPLALCTQEQIDTAVSETGGYIASTGQEFVKVAGQGFRIGDVAYPVRGFNYYPAQYPWRRFLTETDETTLRHDFAQFNALGVNTLRIFLWYEALFQCSGSGAVPNPAGFHRLDLIMRLASDYNLRLIVTLHDTPDLEAYPLYADAPHHQQQRSFIVARYRDEAAVMAWDLRNEGDIDYGTHYAFPARFDRKIVLEWLGKVGQQVRSLDPHHLITAGWLFDSEATAPYVDFVSFHHWSAASDLAGRIAPIQAVTDRPILLQEVGYSTQRVSDEEQARLLKEVISTAEQAHLAGWLVWAAYDFPIDRSCYPSPCQSPDNAEHYFGIWDVTGGAKPAVAVVQEMLSLQK